MIPPQRICESEYDYVLIAVYSFDAMKEIYDQLLQMNVPTDKIKSVVFERELMDTCMDQRMYWIKDYAKWIYEQNLNGSVAECGVFRGDSAKYINEFFPDKKLYLFDTFEGFSETDIEYEIGLQNQNYNESEFTMKPKPSG